jgi:ribosomal protection tetracycline resistance protein
MRNTLRQGLYGWQVTDCTITITQSDYVSPATTSKDFRLLAPLVVMDALKQAGTSVFEPLHHFHLEIPADAFGPVLPVLARLRAVPQAPTMHGASFVLEGMIPAVAVNELQQLLPSLTHGEGVLESAFDRYELVRGTAPTRERTDNNPLNRKLYLLSVVGPSAIRPSTKT